MSGGSYDYICYKIEGIELCNIDKDPRRASFQKLLKLVGEAMHDIEWVDSCDYGIGADHNAIDRVFGFLGTDPEIIKKAHAYDQLRERLLELRKVQLGPVSLSKVKVERLTAGKRPAFFGERNGRFEI